MDLNDETSELVNIQLRTSTGIEEKPVDLTTSHLDAAANRQTHEPGRVSYNMT